MGLNDMLKMSGHIGNLAKCIIDTENRIQVISRDFFYNLTKKEHKHSNSIYNLLPDIISHLSSDVSLEPQLFREIMSYVLSLINKENHIEGLIDKLLLRLTRNKDAKYLRDISFCISQLTLTEKGIKKLSDQVEMYQEALKDVDVSEYFRCLIVKSRKSAKDEVRRSLDLLEKKIENISPQ